MSNWPPSPDDQVIHHVQRLCYGIPPISEISVDVTERTLSGPYDVTVYDMDTGSLVGTRTFAVRRAAIDYAHTCCLGEEV